MVQRLGVAGDDEDVGQRLRVDDPAAFLHRHHFLRNDEGIDAQADRAAVMTVGKRDVAEQRAAVDAAEFRQVAPVQGGRTGGARAGFVAELEEGAIDQAAVGADAFLPFVGDGLVLEFHLVGEDGGGFTDRVVQLAVEAFPDHQIDPGGEQAEQHADPEPAAD